MLILTRRPSETICIGDEVTITVLGIAGTQVRFGIEAPREVVIDREEIYQRKKREGARRNADGNRAEPNGNIGEPDEGGGGT